jgi:hypothetical protein
MMKQKESIQQGKSYFSDDLVHLEICDISSRDPRVSISH